MIAVLIVALFFLAGWWLMRAVLGLLVAALQLFSGIYRVLTRRRLSEACGLKSESVRKEI